MGINFLATETTETTEDTESSNGVSVLGVCSMVVSFFSHDNACVERPRAAL